MGIYPAHEFKEQPDGTVVETWKEPGLTRSRVLTPSAWVDRRTDCYCCTCPEWGASDAYCSGFAGRRPCDVHNLPGQADDETGIMPDPVTAARRASSEPRT